MAFGAALMFIRVLVAYCGICFVARVCVTVIQRRPGAEQFPVPGSGQLFIVAINLYACAFTNFE